MRKSMMVPVHHVTPIDKMSGEDPEDSRLLRAMAAEAEDYFLSFA